MRKRIVGMVLAAATVTGCMGEAPPRAPTAVVLPLQTVRLYETGVGYFERSGGANSSAETTLPVPAGHLDDALKTLVVLSEDGKSQVDGLEFESSISEGMARALAGLSKEAGSSISHLQLLSSLEGEEVEVTTEGAVFEGRVIEVARAPKREITKNQKDGESYVESGVEAEAAKRDESGPDLVLLLLTKGHEIRRFQTSEIEAVRPTSPVTKARLGLALNTLSARAAQTRRMLRVMARAKGPVTLGYIAETPLWRTTYRVLLDDEGNKGLLQGWALLHNDTDEDWRKVRVQLVNGRPDSFLFPLAAPRYARRDLATPEHELSTIPQLLDKTPDAIWGDHAGIRGGEIGLAGMGLGATGTGSGYGRGSGSVSVRTIRGAVSKSDLLAIGNLASIAEAEGVESGALFTYTLPQPLDLRAHGSALVPFVQSMMEAKRITWIGGRDADARMGVRFVNSTKQTLPSGPVAFFADGGFAGESAIDRLKPKEQRYIDFGADLDVESSVRVERQRETAERLTYSHGRLAEHYVRIVDEVFTIENRSAQPRSVHWVLNVVNNAKVQGPDEVTFDTRRGKPIAVFEVPARKQVERKVHSEQGLSRATSLGAIDSSLLDRLASSTTLPQEQRDILKEAASRRSEIRATLAEKEKNSQAIKEVERDLKRLRDHLEALGGKTAGVGANPFVTRILAAEDRLTALREDKQQLGEEHEERMGKLEAVLERLNPEK